jgi:hypothetical protein
MSNVGRSQQSYNLFLTEDRLSSQWGQNPSTARRLINFIPSRAGDLKRKPYSPPFATTEPFEGGQPFWYSFAHAYLFYVAGVPTRQIIVGVTDNISTFLYKWVSGGTLTALPAGAHDPPHNPSSGWVGNPLLLYSDGLLYISDGYTPGNGTVYDGTNTWKWGLDIPTAPTINNGSSPGSIQIDLYREYVITEYDSVRKHESPPSARVRYTPPSPATYDVTLDLPARVNKAPGTASDWTAGYADKFRIYASSVDGSGVLYRIAEVASSDIATQFIDTVPFWGESATTAMKPLEPPYRNHKPKPAAVGAKMHNRFALRDPARRSRIWLSGYAEVKEQDPASVNALETVPGTENESITDLNNLSIYENYVELPDESYEVRAMLWMEEGMMVGTESSVTFIWGSNPENFRPANTATYGFGLFHRNSFLLTSHGLVMFTDDRKLVLDPAVSPGGDRTSYVIDIGWEKQNELDTTDIQYSNRFTMKHYKYGKERDWLVVSYVGQQAIDGYTAHLIVYDFQLGGWITFDDIKATMVDVIREDQGFQFLVAGNSGTDRKLKVVDGYTTDPNSSYQAAASRVGLPAAGTNTLPANTYRTALLDVGTPDFWKVWNYLSYIKKGSFNVVVNVWYDPADIDNLGAGTALTFRQLESQEYRDNLWAYKKRAVFEFTIAADSNTGSLAGIEINVVDQSNVHQ